MKQTNLFDLPDLIPNGNPKVSGKELRDKGIETAINHADDVCDNWGELAFQFFVNYARNSKVPFMTNDAVMASNGIIPEPPDLRSWGAIAVRAVKSGYISRTGYGEVKNPKHHAAPKSLWQWVQK